MRKMKEKGITLVALMIIIIVLLILAGVTLNLTLGEKGIFNVAKKAGEETNKQTALEILRLKIVDTQTLSYAEKQREPTLQELADKLCADNEIAYVSLSKQEIPTTSDKIEVGESTQIYTKLEKYAYEFEINNNLEIKNISGVKIDNEEQETTEKIPEGYIRPTGIKDITETGEYDVSTYEKVNVKNLYNKTQYDAYGVEQYNNALTENIRKIQNFIVYPGNQHYSIGFQPSLIFYTSSEGTCWAFRGDSNLYCTNPFENWTSILSEHVTMDDTGFWMQYDGQTPVTVDILYAIK